MWDGTLTICILQSLQVISIHPSRVGWDQQLGARQCGFADFNPPIPCGMGPRGLHAGGRWRRFQSTHPVWDGTRSWRRRFRLTRNFNPPIPCGMGPLRGAYVALRRISIHPSRVGWDIRDMIGKTDTGQFQSTHPVWDGTSVT